MSSAKRRSVGTSLSISITTASPQNNYVRLAGTADDLDMIEEISAEDGRSCTRYPEEGCCVISNIDLLGFPPLPEFLPFTSFDRGPAGNRKSQNKIGQLPPPVRGNTIPIIPDVPDLPGVWFFFHPETMSAYIRGVVRWRLH